MSIFSLEKMTPYLAFSLLGITGLDEFESVDRSSELVVKLLYAIFLIMGVILLINMMIALLSNTYQHVQVLAEKLKKNSRTQTEKCVISPAAGKGVFLPSEILYVYFQDMKARHKASQLPPFPPLLLHFHLPDGGCALTFAGIIFLCIRIFLTATLVVKFIPNWSCYHLAANSNN